MTEPRSNRPDGSDKADGRYKESTRNTLQALATVLEARKTASPDTSYVASLHAKGLNKILEKVGEEATETILAAKDAQQSGETGEIIAETADLWFHTLVMLSHLDLGPDDICNELARRFDLSGLEEKASRTTGS